MHGIRRYHVFLWDTSPPARREGDQGGAETNLANLQR